MSRLWVLCRHELRILLISPATYIAAVIALMAMGMLYLLTLLTVGESPQEMLPATLFFSTYWIPVLLVVPMLTMRSLAEERRLGTLETLLTTPINALQLVLAKFVAAYTFYLAVWLAAVAYPLIAALVLRQPDASAQLLDPAALIGGYAFIALSGLLFVAIGIFTSSLTRSQLVAGMLSFSIIFLLIVGVAALRYFHIEGAGLNWLATPLAQYLQVFQHFNDFARGVIDTRPFAYYGSSALLVLGVASLVVESRTGS
jgi:ABC-2 type transport system permease protein